MATQIQFRRGTTAQHSSFTGAIAEVTVNTTNKSVHVHDGSTAGGFELARADLSNASGLSLAGLTTVANLKVSNDLYVSGVSTFVGAVTFQGGTITLGDANTDNVVFTADVNSSIIPNIDNSYDLGSSSQQWRNFYTKNSSIGIATCTSLYASGIVTATDFNSTSDITLKENIRPIENSNEIINGLEGVRFVWKADGKESIGVIAQEVQKTLPELVSNGDIKTVNYNGLIGVLIEAVKDQQRQINELKVKIENLKK